MLEEFAKTIISTYMRQFLPKDQQIRLIFEPPQGTLEIHYIKDKSNETFKITFKDLEDIINGKEKT